MSRGLRNKDRWTAALDEAGHDPIGRRQVPLRLAIDDAALQATPDRARSAVELRYWNEPARVEIELLPDIGPSAEWNFASADQRLWSAVGLLSNTGDDFAGSTATTGTISLGGMGTLGKIDTPGDTDWFRITIAAGEIYNFSVAGTGTERLSKPFLQLFNSSGDLASFSISGDDRSMFDLYHVRGVVFNTSGTYYLSVSSAESGGTGSYSANYFSRVDDYAGSASTTGVVSVGQSWTYGNIDTRHDADWFRTTLTAGATYQFDLEGVPSPLPMDGLVRPYLRLLDDSGNSLRFDIDSGEGANSRISGFTALTSGTFYLSAEAFTTSGTGRYRISATQTSAADDYAGSDLLSPDTIRIAAAAQRVAYGEGRQSVPLFMEMLGQPGWTSIGSSNDSRGFYINNNAAAFAAQNGNTVVISIRGSGSGNDSVPHDNGPGFDIVGDWASAAAFPDLHYANLRAFILNVLESLAPGTEIVLTGHSLGAQAATIAFIDLIQPRIGASLHSANVSLVLFGTPGVPAAIASQFSPDLAHRVVSFTNSGDIVSLLPGQADIEPHIVTQVLDDGHTFDLGVGTPEHSQALYYQIWTDISYFEFYNEWKAAYEAGTTEILALSTEAHIAGGTIHDSFTLSSAGGIVLGLDGDDLIVRPAAQLGSAFISGGVGNDTLLGGAGTDYLDGGSGVDHLSGRDGADLLAGGSNNDGLSGQGGDDRLLGGAGGDRYNVGLNEGYDIIDDCGGTGEDVLVLYTGQLASAFDPSWFTRASDNANDMLIRIPNGPNAWHFDIRIVDAGTSAGGIETIQIRSGAGEALTASTSLADIWLQLAQPTAPPSPPLPGVTPPTSFTNMGSSDRDSIQGGAGNDIIAGLSGFDWLAGGGGNDTLLGGSGGLTGPIPGTFPVLTPGDYLQGGDGDDVLIDDDPAQGLDADHLDGGAGNDTLVFYGAPFPLAPNSGGNERGSGGEGNDRAIIDFRNQNIAVRALTDSMGNMTVYRDSFSQILQLSECETIEFLFGDSADVATGHGEVDRFFGGGGSDRLDGHAGNDTLDGGAGDDRLTGGSGIDWIDGGSGEDHATIDLSDESRNVSLLGNLAASASGFTFVDGTHIRNVELFDLFTGSGNDLLSFASGLSREHSWAAGTGIDHLIVDQSSATTAIDFSVNSDGHFGFINISPFGALGQVGGITFTDVDRFTIIGGSANDEYSGWQLDDVLDGGAGNDEIRGNGGDDQLEGGAGNDDVYGGAGDDTLDGADGTDRLEGGAGDDRIDGGSGDDRLTGGAGIDWLDGGSGQDRAIIDLSDETRNVTLVAGSAASASGATLVDGTHARNVELIDLVSGSGNDLLTFSSGLSGDHSWAAGTGIDHLVVDQSSATTAIDFSVNSDGHFGFINISPFGALGPVGGITFYDVDRFTIIGGSANDEFNGWQLDDVLDGGAGNDEIRGNAGDDTLRGANGNDTLNGGAGDDVLDGGAGLDTLTGGDGLDTVSHASSTSGVQIYLDSQVTWDGVTTDTLSSIENAVGSAHADYIGGSVGSNRLDGGAGNDVLDGGGGDDVLVGGLTGLDHLRGGSGVDQITYAGHATGVQVYLDNQHSWDGVTMDFLSSIENVIGTEHADYMAGDAAANRLEGGTGDDFLEGGAGDDILIGGLTGLDHLRGGEGVDQITYAGHGTGVQIYLNNQHTWDGVTMDFLSSIENAIGSSHADYMAGNATANRLEGGGGDDFLDGGGGDDFLDGGTSGLDTLRGGGGTDTVSYASSGTGVEIYLDNNISWDGVTVDNLSSIEIAIGSAHADYIRGSDSQNVLNGGGGNDQLSGMGGNDQIDGGIGTDIVVLRGLAAEYTVTAEAGGYRVTDAVTGRDGSDLLTGIETLRFSDGSTMALTPAAAIIPEVLPALEGDKTADGREILPSTHDDLAKGDGSSPEVLPAVDDNFVATDKYDLPPVMPPMDEFDPALPSLTEMQQARELMMALIRENPLNSFGNSLTLLDDWSGVAPPSRGEVWD